MGCGGSAEKKSKKAPATPPAKLAAIRNAFFAIDVDGSNSVDRAEFEGVLSKMTEFANLSETERNELFKFIDKDKSGTIQFSEFVDWVLAQEQKHSEDRGDTLAQWAANEGIMALHKAAMAGDEEKVKECLQKEDSVHSVDINDVTPLHFACRAGHVGVASMLLEAKADINAKTKDKGRVPLHAAADKGSVALIKMLLEAGTEINVRDNEKRTPLHWAALTQSGAEPASALLDANADITAVTVKGRTPLHFAALAGNGDIVEVMLGAKPNVNARNTERGNTPLHAAAESGSEKAVRLLLAASADVGARDDSGLMPLHWAVRASKIETATLLLEAKADVNATADESFYGSSPIAMAEEWSTQGMIDLLTKAGGTRPE